MSHDPFDQSVVNPNASSATAPKVYSVGVGVDDQATELIATSVWKKVLIGAVVTLVVVGGLTWEFIVRNADKEIEVDPVGIGSLLVLSSVVGGLLGALLAWKDRAENRRSNDWPINFLSKMLFGYGIVSLFLVWVPIVILGTIIVIILTL